MTGKPTSPHAARAGSAGRGLRRAGTLLLVSLLALGLVPTAVAAAPDTGADAPDTGAGGAGAGVAATGRDYAWESTFTGPGLDGRVADAVVHDDGTGAAVYVAGAFVTAGDARADHVARWDGTRWSTLEGPSGVGTGARVSALTVYDGMLVAGGTFATAGGEQVNRVAAWDGEAWHPLSGPDGTGVSGGQGVFALATYDGELVAGGDFTEAGGVTVDHVARWDGQRWAPLPGEDGVGVDHRIVPPAVNALSEWDGDLIVGGRFTSAGGAPAESIAAWDGNGWSALGDGVGGTVVPSVSALGTFDGELVAGGQFPRAGGTTVNHVARWDGDRWAPLAGSGGVGADNQVYALTVHDGALLVGGSFEQAGGLAAHGVASWDGDDWAVLEGPSGVGVTADLSGRVSTLVNWDGGVLVGGSFERAGGLVANHVAHFDGDDFAVLPGPHGGTGLSGRSGRVQALATYDGDVVAAGGFLQAGHAAAVRVGRWDGERWYPLGDGMPDFNVRTLIEFDGDLIAGGTFRLADGGQVNRIARWDGQGWQPMGGPSGTGMDSDVIDLAVYDGELVAGGQFTEAGGEPISYLARWTGDRWAPLGDGDTDALDGAVRSLGLYDGDLVAGGHFDTAGGESVNGVARWDGQQWSPLSGPDGVGVSFSVEALRAHDGALYVGGAFDEAGGVPAANIARWDGTGWQALGNGVDGRVLDLAVLDGDLIAGGWFDQSGGLVVNHVARWDGGQWSALAQPAGTGTGDRVEALLTVPDRGGNGQALLAGGAFAATGGVANWGLGLYVPARITVGPDPLDFGEVTTGHDAGPESLTVTNSGSDDLTVTGVDVPGPPFAAHGGTCGPVPFTLGPGDSCRLDYTFHPQQEGRATGTVTVVSDAPTSPTTATLTGQGVPPVPEVAVEPDALDIDLVTGQQATRTVELSNPGDADLEWQLAEGPQSHPTRLGHGDEATVPPSRPAPEHRDRFATAPQAGVPAPGFPHPGGAVATDGDGSFEPPAELTLTHSDSWEVANGNTVACTSPGDTTAENRYLRTFTLADFGINDPLEVTGVTFGVESLNRATDITVNLYTLDGAFWYENMDLIGSRTQRLEFQSRTTVTVPVTGSVPAGATIVAEVAAPDLSGVAAFFPGSNDAGETAPSYVSAPDCGAPEPVAYESLGAPWVHLVMTVTARLPIDCDRPGWLPASPTGGTVPAGESRHLEVTVDATGLDAGDHTAHLCVASNDPADPLVDVPVTLTVAPGVSDLEAEIEFARGRFTTELTWTPAGASGEVHVYRDGEVVATVVDTGAYADDLGRVGNGTSVDYRVCVAGTDACTGEVTVVARRGGGPPG